LVSSHATRQDDHAIGNHSNAIFCKPLYSTILEIVFQGLIRQREAVDQRLAALSSGQSHTFLARQRQATARKISQHQHFDSR